MQPLLPPTSTYRLHQRHTSIWYLILMYGLHAGLGKSPLEKFFRFVGLIVQNRAPLERSDKSSSALMPSLAPCLAVVEGQ